MPIYVHVAINFRDGILGHQSNKRLESFAPCLSPSGGFNETKFKDPYKKIRETRKFESIHQKHFVEQKNKGRKTDKSSRLEDSSLCPETSTKTAIQEFHLRKLQTVISIRRRGVTVLVYKLCSPEHVDIYKRCIFWSRKKSGRRSVVKGIR